MGSKGKIVMNILGSIKYLIVKDENVTTYLILWKERSAYSVVHEKRMDL